MLSETWIRNDEHISTTNFDCRVQFKREGERAGGVAKSDAKYFSYNDTKHGH